MKTKTFLQKPIHLHIEHVSRLRICLVLAAGLFTLALVRADSRMLGIVRDAYAEGAGHLGSYLREETARHTSGVHVARDTTISGL